MAQVAAGPSVVVGVGQIVEGDGSGEVEQGALAAEEGGFEGLAVVEEQVADAVELGQGQGQAGLEAEQFEGGAAACEPGVGLAFGGGVQHAGEDQGGGDAGVAGGSAEGAQGVGEVKGLEGVEGEALGADGADEAVVEGIEVDEGEIVAGGVGQGGEAEAFGNLLGGLEEGGIGSEQGGLAGAEGVDQLAESGPLGGRDGELGPEIEKGDLADGAGGADAADKAEGGVGLGAGAGPGVNAADEHGATSMRQAKANMQRTHGKQ